MSQSPEDNAQIAVVDRMEEAGLDFFYVPNGRQGSKRHIGLLKRKGMRNGVLDLCILTPPPAFPGAPGAFLEMKRPGGGGSLSEDQRAFMERVAALGWCAGYADGAQEGIEVLRAWGYKVRPLPGSPRD